MQTPEIKVKPLSSNAFVAFFQRAYRHFLGGWYSFSEKHPKLSSYVYKIFFFLIFSVSVTLWQYLIMLFLPAAFRSLNNGAWGFPNIPIKSAGGIPYVIMGDASGLGYFISFEIAVFTAQCINFPLQRNITFKSHGNVYFQALWYFLGWILVSLFTSAIWGIFNCYLLYWNAPEALIEFVKTMLTGLVSFIIFFFIFLLIFPDRSKQATKAEKRYERLLKKHAPQEALQKAKQKTGALKKLADSENARKESISSASLANAKAIAWDEAVKRLEKMQTKNASADALSAQRETVEKRRIAAAEAAEKSAELLEKYNRLKSA